MEITKRTRSKTMMTQNSMKTTASRMAMVSMLLTASTSAFVTPIRSATTIKPTAFVDTVKWTNSQQPNALPSLRYDSRRFSSSEDKILAPQSSPSASSVDHMYEDAIRRTAIWVAAAVAFGGGLFFFYDTHAAEEFFAGYLLEQSLSVDNLLVFLLLFEYFQVPMSYQDRVLKWGIIGAVVMRAIMIGAGAVAIQQFHQVLLVFAAILIFSSVKILFSDDDSEEEEDLSNNQIVQFATKLVSSTDKFDGDRFFTLVDGVKKATPLFLCMVAVEISDVVFAIDSIPAVFGVTENPLIVFTSNIFAIMGLRSLYTILSKAASELKYLEPAVAVVLGFIGGKMVAEYFGYNVPTEVSLGVVLSMLGTGIGASLLDKSEEAAE